MLVNGKSSSIISIEDRGLLYGDGLFETILCENGEPILFAEHMQRLQLGCKKLDLQVPNVELIYSELCETANNKSGIVKIILTRGVRARGYRYNPQEQNSTRIVYRDELPNIPQSYYQDGIRLYLCEHRLPENEHLAEIKHLNRLDQVLARSEWTQNYQEGITLSNSGYVVEGTMSNVFIELQDQWITPKLDRCGVRGVMRDFILQHVEEKLLNCAEADISLTQLRDANAVFMCNSVIGVWPVTRFESINYAVSEPIVRLMKHLHNNVSSLYVDVDD